MRYKKIGEEIHGKKKIERKKTREEEVSK